MGERVAVLNPLARGFYTVSDAARLIEHARVQRIYGWLKGFPLRNIGPLLERDFAPINDHHELSFLDLIEIQFVEHFRYHNVKMRTLRRAAERLRQEFKTPHPFATDKVHLIGDQADVFLVIMRESAKEASDRALLSLTTDHYVIEEVIRKGLVPGIDFERETHFARRWAPRPREFPEIIVDPKIGYGQAAGPSGIPTAVLLRAWLAANEDDDETAYWHNIKAQDVQRAIEFERFLDLARTEAA